MKQRWSRKRSRNAWHV